MVGTAFAAVRVPFTILGPIQYLVPIINLVLGWLVVVATAAVLLAAALLVWPLPWRVRLLAVPLAPGVQWQNHEGLPAAKEKVELQLNGRGRVLIRASGTEPKLRLMVEAEDAELAEEGVRQLVAVNLAA